jgi:restriction system protein
MPRTNPRLEFDPKFVGRTAELERLRNALLRRDRWPPRIVAVNGPGGVGKTSLIRHFLATSRLSDTPVWIDLYADARAAEQIDSFVERMLSGRETRRRDLLVVLDGAEQLNDKQIETAVGRIFNWKAVRGLLISSRRKISLERFSHYSSETLDLGPLDLETATALLKSASDLSLDPADLTRLANAVNGYPLALQLIASLVRTNDPGEIARLLAGNFYDLSDLVSAPSSEIIDIAKPVIISASEALVRNLQKRPEDLLRISPRDFEMVLAELLTDMGWEVELTKATRDGGKDILAYMNTSIGRLLCLVEAKQYRKDRKIGVDLVRTLYGTLCDYQANSAMMVTTSTFSRDAHEFQQRHQYQLSLRDYTDVVTWITKFKRNGKA